MPNSIIIIWFGYISKSRRRFDLWPETAGLFAGRRRGRGVPPRPTHIHFQRGGNDLYVFTDDDIADGAVNHGVVLQGYFLGTAGIEWVV